ncbi:DUF2252 domain-containing protein [Streptomyces sp. Je 1-4]|uniref:DUF2252 domain-containing protein n=1 Tax=Streptomyces TaxID=1883 RepID=UPI00140EE304|nr:MULTISPECIES: DUF2252 domain-containing protein [unclassified Streptomyces]QIK09996.1 DUF2252 domain-containing protein [Streptomyces sp. ID38640]UYB43749.1 DUF2252 domain-containing protein [Streptomyces sp. Je 1-4]UZQ40157.1 DUF2252 domain-containing protein [Streptomyces sp. Je 1-4] [Streptomyces sp. Je 1-4 4N24]UZQ47574.1 DUF2252 domain-containing protein [Streptomyces sp. Je 1-4] [Streptomyces sp. Je 1-4 4N24_ara]
MATGPTAQERAEQGRALRSEVPRSRHAEFEPTASRADPVDLIERQSAVRVPELVPIRYGRMLESPFRFYRGAAAIMAADLATTPSTGLRTQLCGDAHLLNFRLLASPERHLMFDINDFDETLPGPWEWDVKRLAASFAIAGRGNGFSEPVRAGIVRAACASYRDRMRQYADQRTLEVWYAHADMADIQAEEAQELGSRGRAGLSRIIAEARTHDTVQAFRKLTRRSGGQVRIAADPPLIVPLDDLLPDVERDQLEEQIRGLVQGYARSLRSDHRRLLEQYRVVDTARKVVGVGSVGTRCWIVLMLGKDADDPLLLQAKEADESALAPYAGPGVHTNQGARVVAGQRLMQAASDIFLGWDRVTGIDGRQRDFYVRQLRDWKGIMPADMMVPVGMRRFAVRCGATLARAHARSGDRIAIAAYLGSGTVFDEALARFAERYADQNERDHQALVDAVREGRVTARPG